MAEAKRGFGSFHASNVQELLSLPDDQYTAPPVPIDVPVFEDPPVFGIEAKEKYFLLEDGVIFLNHGAFGCVVKQALTASQRWQEYCERQPLRFFDRQLLPQLVSVARQLAVLVDCDARDMVLVQNATTAINSVVGSAGVQRGDTVYCLSSTYGAVKKLLQHVCEAAGATLQIATLHFPLASVDDVVKLVDQTLAAGTRLAVFDHIPSNTPFVLPLDRIIPLCRDRGVPVLVDGAHSLGSISMSMRSLRPDFYAFNCHKWLCAPKGCGALYVAKEHQAKTRPAVISHGLGSGFSQEFIWAGLRDYTAMLALPVALAFWKHVGRAELLSRNVQLAHHAAQHMVTSWNSHLLAPLSDCGPMICVALPRALYENIPHEQVCYDHAEKVQNALYSRHGIEVPIKAVQGHLYVRISAHIYNAYDEYDRLVHAAFDLVISKLLATDSLAMGTG